MTRLAAALATASVLILAGCSDDPDHPDPERTTATATDEPAAQPPRFENARIVVRPGDDRAYVGYTIIGSGTSQYASPHQVRATLPDGTKIEWKHQTATGGPADIVAPAGRRAIKPASGRGGDADYFATSSLPPIGQTVTVTFLFDSGPVTVPFTVTTAR